MIHQRKKLILVPNLDSTTLESLLKCNDKLIEIIQFHVDQKLITSDLIKLQQRLSLNLKYIYEYLLVITDKRDDVQVGDGCVSVKPGNLGGLLDTLKQIHFVKDKEILDGNRLAPPFYLAKDQRLYVDDYTANCYMKKMLGCDFEEEIEGYEEDEDEEDGDEEEEYYDEQEQYDEDDDSIDSNDDNIENIDSLLDNLITNQTEDEISLEIPFNDLFFSDCEDDAYIPNISSFKTD